MEEICAITGNTRCDIDNRVIVVALKPDSCTGDTKIRKDGSSEGYQKITEKYTELFFHRNKY